jgi:hypothetical protein
LTGSIQCKKMPVYTGRQLVVALCSKPSELINNNKDNVNSNALPRFVCRAALPLLPETEAPSGWTSNILKLIGARGSPGMYQAGPRKPQTATGNLVDSLGFLSSGEIPDQVIIHNIRNNRCRSATHEQCLVTKIHRKFKTKQIQERTCLILATHAYCKIQFVLRLF